MDVQGQAAVRSAYGARVAEYAARFGAVTDLHPADLAVIRDWASRCSGPLMDVGCGPGHLTADLHALGHDIRGIDITAQFVEHARATHPGVHYAVGSADELVVPPGSLGGVLAWYSLIHHAPETVDAVLARLRLAIRPTGWLLVGCFTGEELEPFDHAISTAWFWPVEAMTARLERAGFAVQERHTRRHATPRPRPHAAFLAQAV